MLSADGCAARARQPLVTSHTLDYGWVRQNPARGLWARRLSCSSNPYHAYRARSTPCSPLANIYRYRAAPESAGRRPFRGGGGKPPTAAPVRRGRQGYLQIQGIRPQTLAYGLTDSPGRAAGLDRREGQGVDRPRQGAARPGPGRGQLLSNVSVCRLTRSGASAATFLYEAAHAVPEWGAPHRHRPA
jgi:hypothetical protein